MKLNRFKRTVSALALSLSLGLAISATTTHQAHAYRTVFDPWNYRQNILTAVRSLTEINQQINQLRNEAQSLLKMDLNLAKLTSTISPELSRTLGEIRTLMNRANTIAMSVRQTDEAMRQLFPKEFSASLSGDDILRQAKARWQQTLSAYKRSASLQAKVIENADTDATLLSTLLSRSRSSVGNLQASQTGNELTALGVKQSLQLQQMIAAQYRAETLERSRRMVTEEEARVRFNGFLGSRRAYSPGG
ncbi:MAG: P-type conjugative transfer protein TrbJ [Rhodobacteraceae bacterium]|nr:P-type conjugative transfer protein TrbJ [Paracoccaceae bacterium]